MKHSSLFTLLLFWFNLAIFCQNNAEYHRLGITLDELYQLGFPSKIIRNTNVKFDNDTLYYTFLFARMHFRNLDDVKIHLKYKKMKKSSMQSQPQINVFTNKSNRRYKILINENASVNGICYRDFTLSSLIGWYGHEMGHIIDYLERSDIGLMVFAIKYLFSDSFMRSAEIFADSSAVFHGLGCHLLEGAEFCLSSDKISHSYKQKLTDFYMLPDDIRKLIADFEATIIR